VKNHSAQRNCTLANSETPLPISLRCLGCVDNELSALAVKTLSHCAVSATTCKSDGMESQHMKHEQRHEQRCLFGNNIQYNDVICT